MLCQDAARHDHAKGRPWRTDETTRSWRGTTVVSRQRTAAPACATPGAVPPRCRPPCRPPCRRLPPPPPLGPGGYPPPTASAFAPPGPSRRSLRAAPHRRPAAGHAGASAWAASLIDAVIFFLVLRDAAIRLPAHPHARACTSPCSDNGSAPQHFTLSILALVHHRRSSSSLYGTILIGGPRGQSRRHDGRRHPGGAGRRRRQRWAYGRAFWRAPWSSRCSWRPPSSSVWISTCSSPVGRQAPDPARQGRQHGGPPRPGRCG